MEVLILLLVGIVLILIFKSTTKKQNQSYLTKKTIKKATQNKDNSLYQSSQKQRGQKPTKKNNYYQKIWKKGANGENAFKAFLKEIEIPFIAVEQNKYTKYSRFKRPDFILGYEDNANKLTLAFEVKNKQTYPDKFGHKCHKLEIEELDGLENFSKDMFMPVYFAFKDGGDWLFISLEGFLEFSFGYKNELYIQLHFFERGVKSRNDFDNFINKHKTL